MRQIPVESSTDTVMVAQAPEPKIRDRRTGEIATDAETSATLMTWNVMFARRARAASLLCFRLPGRGGEQQGAERVPWAP